MAPRPVCYFSPGSYFLLLYIIYGLVPYVTLLCKAPGIVYWAQGEISSSPLRRYCDSYQFLLGQTILVYVARITLPVYSQKVIYYTLNKYCN